MFQYETLQYTQRGKTMGEIIHIEDYFPRNLKCEDELNMKIFNDYYEKILKNNPKNQKNFCKLCEINSYQLERIKKGDLRYVELDSLMKMASVICVDIEQLVDFAPQIHN